MTHLRDSRTAAPGASAFVKDTLAAHPCARGTVVMTCSPAVVDVMGGIVEDSGSLVLTTTLATPGGVALWHIKDDLVRLRRGTTAGDDAALEFDLPIGAFEPSATTAEAIAARCREAGCEWAAPICLTLR